MRFLLLTLVLAFSTTTIAKEVYPKRQAPKQQEMGWLWGGGIIYTTPIYKEWDSRIIPLPLFVYRGERFNFQGLSASYLLWRDKHIKFNVLAAPRFDALDDEESDFYTGIEDRDPTIEAGLGLDFRYQAWSLSTKLQHDILNKHKGFEANVSLGYQFKAGRFLFEPQLTYFYQNEDLVQYYYGVSAAEVNDERSLFTPDGAHNISASFAIKTRATGGLWSLRLATTSYDEDNIFDSPLVEDGHDFTVMLSFLTH